MRIDAKLNRSELLCLLERKPGLLLPRKGKQPVPLGNAESMVQVVTTNYLTPTASWVQMDIDAVYDRCFPAIVLDPVLQHRNNAVASRCRKCAARFLLWCAAKAQPEAYKPKLVAELAEDAAPSHAPVPLAAPEIPDPKRKKIAAQPEIPDSKRKEAAVQQGGKKTPPPQEAKTPLPGEGKKGGSPSKRFANLESPVEPLGMDELLAMAWGCSIL
jgi:hypothetical protein